MFRGADPLITEAFYERPTSNHYTIKQVKNLALEAKASRTLVINVRSQLEHEVKKLIRKKKNLFWPRME